MGYHTEFTGYWEVKPTLKPEHIAYLQAFAGTRRMLRSSGKAMSLPDPIRQAALLPIGEGGCYYVGAEGFMGQDTDVSVLEYNSPPPGQPGLWCHWTASSDGFRIEWDGGEKFHDYIDWIEYLIKSFLKPWGYTLNGAIQWDGEEQGDVGRLVIKDNVVTPQYATLITSW